MFLRLLFFLLLDLAKEPVAFPMTFEFEEAFFLSPVDIPVSS